jgi:Flp pilus assembly protein TadG
MRHQLRTIASRVRERTGGDSGQVTAFATIMTIALLLVAGLVLDAGMALSVKVQALDVAQSAARAGAQELNLTAYRTSGIAELNPAQAESAARTWLTTAGFTGEATATTHTVTVTVHGTSRTQLLHLVGVRQLAVSATATATAVQGVTGPNT